MKKETKLLLGCAALAITGSLIGVLCMPDKAERTRRKLIRKAKRLACAIDGTASSGRETLDMIVSYLQDKAETHKGNDH